MKTLITIFFITFYFSNLGLAEELSQEIPEDKVLEYLKDNSRKFGLPKMETSDNVKIENESYSGLVTSGFWGFIGLTTNDPENDRRYKEYTVTYQIQGQTYIFENCGVTDNYGCGQLRVHGCSSFKKDGKNYFLNNPGDHKVYDLDLKRKCEQKDSSITHEKRNESGDDIENQNSNSAAESSSTTER